ncbi:hypothetical protein Tco_1251242, partial [Tanacetum coccineum]
MESPKVEIAKEKEVEISKEKKVELTNVVIPVNVNDEDEEITDEVYELKRMEKGKIVEETRNSPIPTPIRSPRIHTNLVSSDTKKLQGYSSYYIIIKFTSQKLQGRYGYLFAHLRARFMPRKLFDTLVDNLHDVMVETLPTMIDKHIKEQRQKAKEETERLIAKAILHERGNIQAQISTQIENAIANVIHSQVDAFVRSYMTRHILHVHQAQSQTSSVPEQQYQLTLAVRPRDQYDPHDDAHPEGENSAKRQKTSEYEAYTDSYASDIMEEVSLTIDEAKLRKMADEMLRQKCTSGNEHQYHIDQMKN